MNEYPNIQTKVKKINIDGKWFIESKTTITDLKPLAYYEVLI